MFTYILIYLYETTNLLINSEKKPKTIGILTFLILEKRECNRVLSLFIKYENLHRYSVSAHL